MKYIVLIAIFGIVGFTPGPRPWPGRPAENESKLESYYDANKKVTCYRVVGSDGLSCIKDKK